LRRHIETLVADNVCWQTMLADDVMWELPFASASLLREATGLGLSVAAVLGDAAGVVMGRPSTGRPLVVR
jgi:hypothetical protein